MHSTLMTSVKLKVFAFQAVVSEASPLMRDLATETLSHAKCSGGVFISVPQNEYLVSK